MAPCVAASRNFNMQSESTCPRCGTGRDAGSGAPDRPSGGTRWTLLRGAAESRGIPLWTIVSIVGLAAMIYVGGKVLYRLRDILIVLAVSGFIALILNPLVVMFQRRIAPRRSVAVAIVTVSAVLIFVGVAVGCGYPLAAGTTHLADQLPGYVANAEHGQGWAGHLLRRYHVQAWAQRNAPMLMNVAQGFGKSALAVGRSAVSLAATLTTVFVLTVLLLLEGPKLRSGILARMRPERAARCVEVAAEVRRSVAGYVVGNLLTSAIAGTVVLVTLLAVGVPFAPVVGTVGRPGRLPPDSRRRAGRHTHHIVCLRPFSYRGDRDPRGIHCLYPVRESHPEPVGHEQDCENQSAARIHICSGRVLDRQLDRRALRWLRGMLARYPLRRRNSGSRQRGLARNRRS